MKYFVHLIKRATCIYYYRAASVILVAASHTLFAVCNLLCMQILHNAHASRICSLLLLWTY